MIKNKNYDNYQNDKNKKNNTMIDYLGILIKKYGGILIAEGDQKKNKLI